MRTISKNNPLKGQSEMIGPVTQRKRDRISYIFGQKAIGNLFRLKESLNLISSSGRKRPEVP